MTNTERLIASLEFSKKFRVNHINFYVGKMTGNGTSVIAALRKRGFDVQKLGIGRYRLANFAEKNPQE